MKKQFMFSAVVIGLFASFSLAADIYVDPNESIQAAIDAADPNGLDTIIVSPGRYAENIHFKNKNIILTSIDPSDPSIVDSTIIEGLGNGSVVFLGVGQTADCALRGFTITNGDAIGAGAGIDTWNSWASIENCVLTGNTARSVYGIISHSQGTISQCRIFGNTTTSDSCAGLYGCSGTIIDCEISGNTGTAISGCNGTIENCMISGNTAIGLSGCNGLISNCVIADNGGGGLWYCDGQIRNCLITGNHSGTVGGGLAYCDGDISNCTIYGNTTDDPMGGAGVAYCYGSVTNCIIWENDIRMYQTPTPGWGPTVFTYCCVQGLTSKDSFGNMGEDPLFADPNHSDFHLKSQYGRWDPNSRQWVCDEVTSPCIDAGDPADTGVLEELWPYGERINMGVYGGSAQASMSANTTGNIADLNHDESINQVDFGMFADDWMRQEVLMDCDLDRDNDNDMDDLILFIDNWLWIEPSLAYDWDTNPGTGDPNHPYQISEPYQLNAIGLDSTLWDKSFILTANIDMSEYLDTQYNIIGTTYTYPFTGIFDGNGYVIGNLTYSTISGVNYVGLFGYLENATIENLGVENVAISTKDSYAGGLAGSVSGGSIINCYTTGEVTSEFHTGGLVGIQSGGSIVHSSSLCAVLASSCSYPRAGGITGFLSDGTIENCCNKGTVTATTSCTISFAGGIVGTQIGSISGCCNTGMITANSSVSTSSYAGGIAGRQSTGSMENCYNTGAVYSITPRTYATTISYAGGIAGIQGNNINAIIEDCYSSGLVFASGTTDYPGGLLGYKDGSDSTIAECFWDTESSGTTDGVGNQEPDPAGAVGLSTELMMQQASFTGWDFVETWRIDEGITCPYLWWE